MANPFFYIKEPSPGAKSLSLIYLQFRVHRVSYGGLTSSTKEIIREKTNNEIKKRTPRKGTKPQVVLCFQ